MDLGFQIGWDLAVPIMEGGQADAAVLQGGGADAGFDRTIGNRLQVVVDGDVHVQHRAGNQRRLGLGIGIVLVDIGADGRQVVCLGSQQSTVNGALLAAEANNLPAIGADIDQYNTDPEAQSALISSAMLNVDVAVYNYLKTVADGSVKAGISTATLQNGGVGLAPFHDWDSKIPADLKAQIQKASDGIKDGSITIDLP